MDKYLALLETLANDPLTPAKVVVWAERLYDLITGNSGGLANHNTVTIRDLTALDMFARGGDLRGIDRVVNS